MILADNEHSITLLVVDSKTEKKKDKNQKITYAKLEI